MKNMMSKVLAPLAALLLHVLLVSGCEPQPVTAVDIFTVNAEVIELMRHSLTLSQATANSVDVAYQDLSVYLRTHSLTDDRIIAMENYRVEIKGRVGKLKESLKNARERAGYLFSLLKRRTEENQTPQWKEQMIAAISISEGEFNRRMNLVLEEVANLDVSIQRYDDVLGYAQVVVGLGAIDSLTGEVDELKRQSNQTNQEVQRGIMEGLMVVNSIRSSRPY